MSKTRAIPFIGVSAGACDIPRSSKILCKRLDDNDIVLVETPTMVLYHSVSLLSFSLSLAGIIRILNPSMVDCPCHRHARSMSS